MSERGEHDRRQAIIAATIRTVTDLYHDQWKDFCDIYELASDGEAWAEDEVNVPVTHAIVNTIIPALTHNRPKINVYPLVEADELGSVIAQQAINSEWRRLKVKKETKAAVKDAVLTGTGWIKVVYERRNTKRKLTDEEKWEQAQAQEAEALQYAEENPDMAASIPTKDDIMSALTPHVWEKTTDDLRVARISPYDVFVDCDATSSFETAGHVIHRSWVDPEKAKRNPRYNREVLEALPASGVSDRYSIPVTNNREENENFRRQFARLEVFEYYDTTKRSVTTYLAGNPTPLVKERGWPGNVLPLVPYRYTTVTKRFYGIGVMQAIESQQLELNKTRTQMINQRKQFHRKGLYRDGAILPHHIDELRSDVDGILVPVQEGNPEDAIKMLLPPQIDTQLAQLNNILRDDLTEISGVSEYQRGLAPDIRRTATEASLIESSASVRAEEKLSEVEDFMADVANVLLHLMIRYYDEPRQIRVVGLDKQVTWIEMSAMMMAGDYRVEIEAGSTQPRNDAQKKQEMLALFSTLVGNEGINQMELNKLLLNAFKVPGLEKLLVDPMAAMMGMAPGMPGADPLAAAGAVTQAAAGPQGTQQEMPGALEAQVAALQNQMAGQGPPRPAPAR